MVIKIIQSCFNEYEKKSKISTFSVKFDYNILKQGINIINLIIKLFNVIKFKFKLLYYLASNIIFLNDHSLCISKILWLYYKNGHVMMIDHVHDFVKDIYSNKFFVLFFHWSWQVRNMFYYFILFFLNHRIKHLILPKGKLNRRHSSDETIKKGNVEDYAENVFFKY
jgi:hypothetical protein